MYILYRYRNSFLYALFMTHKHDLQYTNGGSYLCIQELHGSMTAYVTSVMNSILNVQLYLLYFTLPYSMVNCTSQTSPINGYLHFLCLKASSSMATYTSCVSKHHHQWLLTLLVSKASSSMATYTSCVSKHHHQWLLTLLVSKASSSMVTYTSCVSKHHHQWPLTLLVSQSIIINGYLHFLCLRHHHQWPLTLLVSQSIIINGYLHFLCLKASSSMATYTSCV